MSRLDPLLDRGLPVLLCAVTLWAWLAHLPLVYAVAVTVACYVAAGKLVAARRAKFTTRHALYRFYDLTGRLLYIGITSSPRLRFEQHKALKPWWADVAVREVTFYPTRELLESAEIKAIRRERPLYNIIHNRAVR